MVVALRSGHIPPAPHSHPLAKPLDAEQVFTSICQVKPEVTTIPIGLKSYVYFIIDNTDNMDRQAHGKRAEYVEDCGAWDTRKGSLKRNSYVVSNSRLKNIKRKDGVYGRFTRKEFVPFDPQPNENDVLCRYHCGLKGESGYRCRVTWETNCQAMLMLSSAMSLLWDTLASSHRNRWPMEMPGRRPNCTCVLPSKHETRSSRDSTATNHGMCTNAWFGMTASMRHMTWNRYKT